MKKRLILQLLVLVCISVNATPSVFFDGTWEQAREKARKENKYIFLDCWTEWCHYCKVMDEKTLVDSTVVEFMQQNFVSVSRDMERGEGRLLSMKYHTEQYPTFLIFTPAGKLCYNLAGYMLPQEFIDSLQHALTPSKQHICTGFSDELDPGYPEFYKHSFGIGEDRKFADSSEVISWLSKQQDWSSEICWAVLWRFAGGVKHQQWTLANSAKLYELYGHEVWLRVSGLLGYYSFVAGREKSDSLFENVLRQCNLYLPEPYRSERIEITRRHYYEKTENWKLYGEHQDLQFRKINFQYPLFVIESSWLIFEKCEDTSVIAIAIAWMEIIITRDTSWQAHDTYAHLLFKTGRYEEAEIEAQAAIEIAAREKEEVAETRELLDKIRSRKKD